MKEDYVTFEQSVKLKGLGFDPECIGSYDNFGNFKESAYPHNYNDSSKYSYIVSAPTLSFAQKWLREVKKLHVYADINSLNLWYASAVNLDSNEDLIWDGAMFNSYELALSHGISQTLTLLTEKQ